MKLKKIIFAVVAALGLAVSIVGLTNTEVNAAVKSPIKSYKAMPAVLRGTWRTGYLNNGKNKPKRRDTYTFKKNSYVLKIDYKGGKKKSKKMTIPRTKIGTIEYSYTNKQYQILFPSKKYSAYAGFLAMKPVRHKGKQALHWINDSDKHLYLYKVRK